MPFFSSSPSARRVFLAAALLFALVLASIALYRGWGRQPPLPDLSLDGMDPAVAAAVTSSLERIRGEPRSADAWGRLGKILYGNGFIGESCSCFLQAERLQKDEPRWPYLAGLALREKGADEFAFLQRAVALAKTADPLNLVPQMELAETLLARDREEEAETLFRAVEQLQPGDARAQYQLAWLASQRREWSAAVPRLSRLVDNPYARRKSLMLLARISRGLGDVPTAERYSRQALEGEEDVSWPDPYQDECAALSVGSRGDFLRVKGMIAAGRVQEAASLLQEMTATKGVDLPAVQLRLATLLMASRRLAEAEQLARACLKTDPQDFAAAEFLARVLIEGGERLPPSAQAQAQAQFREAAELVGRVVEAQPGHGTAYAVLGRALLHQGQRRSAILAFRRAVERRPERPEIHLRLAEALEQDGDDRGALEEYQAAVRCSPHDPTLAAALQRFQTRRHSRPEK